MFVRHNLKISVTVFVKKILHIEYVDTYVVCVCLCVYIYRCRIFTEGTNLISMDIDILEINQIYCITASYKVTESVL